MHVKKNTTGFLSDILSAICNGEYDLPFSHEKEYWIQKGNKEKEIFANLFSVEAYEDQESIDFLHKHFPDMMQAYENLW